MKTFSIPLRLPSAKSDYACADGEIASFSNLKIAGAAAGTTGGDGGDTGGVNPVSTGFSLSLPTAPEVEFALKRGVLPGWHIHPDMLPSRIMEKGEASEAGWGKKAREALAAFRKDAERHNLFVQPFLAMCAVRLADGHRILPSPPVLMIPNSEAPCVAGTTDFSSDTMELRVAAAVCSLQWRLHVPEELMDFNGATHIDILISSPLPLYDTKGDLTAFHRFDFEGFTHSIATDGTAGERPVTTETLAECWRPEPIDEAIFTKALLETDEFHLVSEMPLNGDSGELSFTEWRDVDFNCGGLAMAGAFGSYTPSFAHLSAVDGVSCSEISGRLTVGGITLTSPLPYPLWQTAAYVSDADYSPRWVFHPDPRAESWPFESGDGVCALPLRRHPRWYGSFHWHGLRGERARLSPVPASSQATPSLESRTARHPGMIWRSEKFNQAVFPDALMMPLAVGNVTAVCRAFRASGLVATTSPTAYAFTSEGVYLLKEMADGTFRDAGLICTHAIRDTASVRVYGKSLQFTAITGETYSIEGTTVKALPYSASSGASGDVISGNLTAALSGSATSVAVAFEAVDPEKPCSFTTRPLKLGEPEAWKRVVSLTLRGNFNLSDTNTTGAGASIGNFDPTGGNFNPTGGNFDPTGAEARGVATLALYGSADLHTWQLIARTTGATLSMLWSSPFRFHRVEATLPLPLHTTIQALTLQTHPL